MAGKFEQGSDITTVVFPEEYENDQYDQTDADIKTDAIAAALNDDPNAFLNVSRQSDGGRSPMEFVGRFPADKYDFGQLQIHLQDNYGGGDYRCMLYVKGKVRANRLLTIASPKIRGESGNNGDMMKLVLDRMEKMQNQIVTIMQEKQTGGNSRMEFMQEMMLMKQMFSTDNKSSNGIKDVIETLGGLKELGINLGGAIAESEGGGFDRLLTLAAPLLTSAMQPQQQTPQQNQPQIRRQPVQQKPLQNPAPRHQPTPEQKEQHQMNLMLRMGINQLVTAAKKDSEHHAYAVMVLDNIPEEKVMEFFKDPTGMVKLVEIQPEVSNHLVWFETLGEHIKAIMGLPCKPEIAEQYDDGDDNDLVNDIDPIDASEVDSQESPSIESTADNGKN